MTTPVLCTLLLFFAQPASAQPQADEAPLQDEAQKPFDVVTQTRQGMGTRLEIQVYSNQPDDAQSAISAAFNEMHRVAGLLSEWQADSDISAINTAGGKPVRVSPETIEVLLAGKRWSQASQKAFSMSWAVLASVWDSTPVEERHEPPDWISNVSRTAFVNDEDIFVDPATQTVKLGNPGMALGLGAIGKGYALDRAMAVLHARGFTDALVFAGGDILVSGRKGDKPWVIGVQDPRGEGHFAILLASDEAIASSGDYERYIEVDGERYPHIFDPRSGMPARGCRSVTVIAQNAMDADALATAAFVLGPEEGLRFIENIDGVEAVFVTANNEVVLTTGLQPRLRIVRPPSP